MLQRYLQIWGMEKVSENIPANVKDLLYNYIF